MTPRGNEELEPSGQPAPRRKPPRNMDLGKLYDTLQKEPVSLEKLRTNSVGIKFVLLPAGTFKMGSPPGEPGHRLNEAPQHEVTLTQPMYLSVYPVTQEQYHKVLGKNPARFHQENGGSPNHPVENVSWEDALLFCQRLAALPAEQSSNLKYRLPTEAEWEYACRAGTTTAFSFGPALVASQANFAGVHADRKTSSAQKTCPVGSFPANHFGLFDMHGNVWEWCADWYDGVTYAKSPPRDPQGPTEGTLRVVRGGHHNDLFANHAGDLEDAIADEVKR